MHKTWSLSDMPDLTGKVAVVTGASSGIGLHTARYLALHGAKVYFTARSEAKAKQTVDFILSQHSTIQREQLIWLELDLGTMGSVVRAIEKLKSSEEKLHLLINNGGAGASSFQLTPEGWELGMAVFYLGHALLTNGLLPLLKKAASEKGSDVRILTLASEMPRIVFPADYSFDYISDKAFTGYLPYEPWQYRYIWKNVFHSEADVLRYAMAKLACEMFMKELQRAFDEQGIPILCLSPDPGAVKTNNADSTFPAPMRALIRMLQVTADKGCYNSLFAATSPEVAKHPETYKGNYLDGTGLVKTNHPVVNDERQRKGLWKNTTDELNKHLALQGYSPLNAW